VQISVRTRAGIRVGAPRSWPFGSLPTTIKLGLVTSAAITITLCRTKSAARAGS
jgi:hypothetical protein